jgi:hypothetical protein
MPYINKTAIRPYVSLSNGSEIITFQETPCTYKEEDVNSATEYFNPVTGLFDSSWTTLNFESGVELLIKQSYTATAAELIALN